ncbi:MAG: phosphoenolpyruvate mutase [Acidimicrobiia bacterium]|nr:phosphoenolpyruvate mutase [Acidimicrobiia bacterium]MBT8218062.1 phosphoenolpyruvate mutase [Acidimicrobiia bacterium]NNF11496.1 phosphoenolpyruvate mutase [Acidimicrobiia bacterium]NNL68906.1 phosphoenolpyruvate mutase [Acidimicrobiia bacterium]
MEAHNGLSAKIAEEAGFEALWGSGLSLSAALGVRDNNEATWTQILEVVEFMSDNTSIPILLDGDTGFGDFNTMRRLVRKLESRNIAGVCIEDKLFPKTNSFIRGNTQPLADIDEFAGKIRAGVEAKSDPDFVIVARVEAFIAGWGLDEALRRAEAYHEAGADAILMHSARRDPSEVFEFARHWQQRCPVILVPTKYYTTPTDAFREHGIAAVIWANHLLRGSIEKMQQIAAQIKTEESLTSVEDRIAAVGEVFRLQGATELAEAERRYLPAKSAEQTKAFILAAVRGEEMGELTEDRPKAMVEVGGKPILQHIVDTYRQAGIRDLNVIRGYKKEAVTVDGVNYFDSPDDGRRAEVLALTSIADELEGSVIVSYGDVLFRRFIPRVLADSAADFAVMIDLNWQASRNRNRYADYVVCRPDPVSASFYQEITLEKLVTDPSHPDIHGEWMGFLKMSPKGSAIVRELLEEPGDAFDGPLKQADMGALINKIIAAGHDVKVFHTTGNWIDCDSALDAIAGSQFQ